AVPPPEEVEGTIRVSRLLIPVAIGTAISWWLIPSSMVHLSGVLLLVSLSTISGRPASGTVFREMVLYLWILFVMRLRPEWIPLSASPDALTTRGYHAAIATVLVTGFLLVTDRRRLIPAGVFIVLAGLNFLFSCGFPDGWNFLRDRISLTLEPWSGARRILTIGEVWIGCLLLCHRRGTSPTEKQRIPSFRTKVVPSGNRDGISLRWSTVDGSTTVEPLEYPRSPTIQ
ncbi:MAG: hypothetical protein Q4C47_04035, partial [Planctomycetia bacterium]|nr:hypothetical protein [Planctomycetia bacterium]